MGRRQLENERSTEMICLRVTTKQKEFLLRESENFNMKLGEYIKYVLKQKHKGEI